MSAKKIAYQKTSLSMIEKTINNIVQKITFATSTNHVFRPTSTKVVLQRNAIKFENQIKYPNNWIVFQKLNLDVKSIH